MRAVSICGLMGGGAFTVATNSLRERYKSCGDGCTDSGMGDSKGFLRPRAQVETVASGRQI